MKNEKTIRIYQYVLGNSGSNFNQKEISKKLGVSPQLVNKVFKKLKEEKILNKESKNSHILVDKIRLLTKYVLARSFKEINYFVFGSNFYDIRDYFENQKISYAFTLDSVIELNPSKIYAYVLHKDLKKLDLIKTNFSKANLVLFPVKVLPFREFTGEFWRVKDFELLADMFYFKEYKNILKFFLQII